ncbi:MAG: pantetheine-phosphate adenylyltransferase, partial [Rubrobacteraceae bacterium]
TGLAERAEVLRMDVERGLGKLAGSSQLFNLIFLDPPYRIAPAQVGSLFSRLRLRLVPDGKVVYESGDPPQQSTLELKGVSRRYGKTVITFFERTELTMNVAVCPGSFDPVTEGHLDIIRRAAALFDHVVVAVGGNSRKHPKLPAADRARLIEKVTVGMENVSVEIMNGLLVDFARDQGAQVVIKGLRAVSDFESEFEQAQLNRTLYPALETVFIMAEAKHSFLSSSAVREIALFDGEVRGLVPEGILESVREIYSGGHGKIQTNNDKG